MAYAGQILDNPVSGERIIFRETAADTNGERLTIDLVLAPDGHVPGKHVHPEQVERFEVTSGSMKFTMGHKKVIAHAGDVVVVPAGTAHKFENAGDGVATARVEVTPALRMENLFETAVALAEAGRTNKKGLPKPLDLALFVKEFEREVVGAFPPVWVQKASLAPLRMLARRRELPAPAPRRRSSATHPVLVS
jgi:mannose-6-phosphate isomerase-like protein (cupin superfamily)